MILPHLEIIRLEDNFKYGTFGALLISTAVFCATLEPHEFGNHRNVSCIPPGQYECVRMMSPKFGSTYQVCNVPDRSMIEFHSGNFMSDTEGCILLGQHWGKLKEERGLLNSGKTFREFMGLMQSYAKFKLTVKCAYL